MGSARSTCVAALSRPLPLLQVKRTVRGYAAAGFAGILIEDQQVGCLLSLCF